MTLMDSFGVLTDVSKGSRMWLTENENGYTAGKVVVDGAISRRGDVTSVSGSESSREGAVATKIERERIEMEEERKVEETREFRNAKW
jgi:hypothetical protein